MKRTQCLCHPQRSVRIQDNFKKNHYEVIKKSLDPHATLRMTLVFYILFFLLSPSSLCAKPLLTTVSTKKYKEVKKDYYALKEYSGAFYVLRRYLRKEVSKDEFYFDCIGRREPIGLTGMGLYCVLGSLLNPKTEKTDQECNAVETLHKLESREIGTITGGRFTPLIAADTFLYVAERHKIYITEQHEFETISRI